jgi:hypothetical protein
MIGGAAGGRICVACVWACSKLVRERAAAAAAAWATASRAADDVASVQPGPIADVEADVPADRRAAATDSETWVWL